MTDRKQSNKTGHDSEGNRDKNKHSATKSGQSKSGSHSSSQTRNDERSK